MDQVLVMLDSHGHRVTALIVNENIVLSCHDNPDGCTLSGEQFGDLAEWVADQYETMAENNE
jgi:hypothetical protein